MSEDKRDFYLRKAEAAIVSAEMTISRQLALIERLRWSRVSTEQAEAFLKSLEASMRDFYANREKLMKR
jgi:hypothetical protein